MHVVGSVRTNHRFDRSQTMSRVGLEKNHLGNFRFLMLYIGCHDDEFKLVKLIITLPLRKIVRKMIELFKSQKAP
jgi:hypothetical protein